MNVFVFLTFVLIMISVLCVVTKICDTVRFVKESEYKYLYQAYRKDGGEEEKN